MGEEVGSQSQLISIPSDVVFNVLEKLPEVKKSLRTGGPKEDARLTEFQVELIQLASQLNGDYLLNTYPNIGKGMTVAEGNKYAVDAIQRFLKAGRAALRTGANDSAMVTMRPSLTSCASGEEKSNYISSY
ncbi:hypothetical protein AgCh_034879 [Apium graveolens]